MNSYLKDIYAKDEYASHLYPQRLCNYLYQNYLITKGITDGYLLDIGSGIGNHLVGFSRNGFKCYGIDKRAECVDILDSFDIRECNLENEKLPFVWKYPLLKFILKILFLLPYSLRYADKEEKKSRKLIRFSKE